MSFGLRFKELRNNAGLTQKKLAEGITTKSYISQIEKGVAKPSTQMLEKLSSRLGCTVKNFFEEPENKSYKLVQLKHEIQFLENKTEDAAFDQVEGALKKLKINNKELNSADLGILFWVRGELSRHNKEWEQSINHLNKSIEYFDDKNIEKRIKATNSLARVYLKMDMNEKGLNLLTEAYIEIMRCHIIGLVKQATLINLGIAHGKTGEYRSAIRLLTEVYCINQATDLQFRNGEIFMSLGICYKRTLEPIKAQEAYEQALVYFNLNNDQELKAGTHFNLALLYFEMEQYENAIANLLISIDLFKSLEIKDSFYLAKIHLAQTYKNIKNYDEAIQQCSQILTKANNKKYMFKAHTTLGDIQFDQDNFEQALEHYFDAERVCTKNNLDSEELYKKIGDSHYSLKNFEKAAFYFHQYSHLT